VPILFGRPLLTSQSEQFEMFSKSSDGLEKSCLSKKATWFWTCQQAINDSKLEHRFNGSLE